MKWELVVTDPNAGKTGRVRIESPDQAAAERIAAEKGWVVSSVRPFEASSAPAGSASAAPVSAAESSESDSEPAASPFSGSPKASADASTSDDPEEERPKPVVMPLEKERPTLRYRSHLALPPIRHAGS